MAEVIRYVDPDATGLGNGTSWTDAYTSMNAWEAAEQVDLVTAGDWHHVYTRASSSTADTTNVGIDGWTTDSTHYVKVEGYDDFGGKWDSTKYRLDTSSNYSQSLAANESFTEIENLQIRNTGTSDCAAINLYACDTPLINKCIVRGGSTAGIKIITAGTTKIVNTIVYGSGGSGILKTTDSASIGTNGHFIYNCTINSNGTYGIEDASEYRYLTIKNCYAGNNSTADYGGAGSTAMYFTTSYSSDGSLSTTIAAYSTSSGAYFTNLTSGSEDFHIGSSSALVDNGTDLSSDSDYAFSDDIDGDTRTAPWDVGVDEYVSVSGLAIPVVIKHLIEQRIA